MAAAPTMTPASPPPPLDVTSPGSTVTRSGAMPHDPVTLREETLRRVAALAFPHPPAHYPVLWESEEGYRLRSGHEIAARAAILNVVIGCTYGLPVELGLLWLQRNGLVPLLTNAERDFLGMGDGAPEWFRLQTEGLWALIWVLGLADHIDPNRYCGESLKTLVPDVAKDEPLTEWVQRIRERPADDVMAQLDLHFCLTWGLADANLSRKRAPGAVDQYVLWERRRALEWVIVERGYSVTDWDDIALST